MATLELSTLSDYLDEEEIGEVKSALDENGSAPLDIDDTAEAVVLHGSIDDDVLVDFQDRLDATEVAADIYLPVDFEDAFEVADYRFGSSHALLLALETLREEFSIDGAKTAVADDDDDEEEEEDDDPAPAGDDEVEFDSLDEEDDDDVEDDESAEHMKDDQLRMIWKILHQGAKTAIKRGLCLIVKT